MLKFCDKHQTWDQILEQTQVILNFGGKLVWHLFDFFKIIFMWSFAFWHKFWQNGGFYVELYDLIDNSTR
jgi:hypothetical protein